MVPVRCHRPGYPPCVPGTARQQTHGHCHHLPNEDKEHPFAALCKGQQIEHRIYAPEGTTLVKHPWTNGMVEAMNKKVKANTIKRSHYDNADTLKTHLHHYLLNYNFNLKLRVIGRKTPYS
jgi:hypothetical protein